MDIEFPEFVKSYLWRNYLIGLYQKYWGELQNLLGFKYKLPALLGERLGQIVNQLCPDSSIRRESPEPLAKTARKLEKEFDILEKERSNVREKIEDMSEPDQKKDYSEFTALLKTLETVEKELKNLSVAILTHPNNQIEFVDTESKIVLKTHEKEPS